MPFFILLCIENNNGNLCGHARLQFSAQQRELTDKCVFLLIAAELVAAREERVRVGRLEPRHVAHVHAQPHLQVTSRINGVIFLYFKGFHATVCICALPFPVLAPQSSTADNHTAASAETTDTTNHSEKLVIPIVARSLTAVVVRTLQLINSDVRLSCQS